MTEENDTNPDGVQKFTVEEQYIIDFLDPAYKAMYAAISENQDTLKNAQAHEMIIALMRFQCYRLSHLCAVAGVKPAGKSDLIMKMTESFMAEFSTQLDMWESRLALQALERTFEEMGATVIKVDL